MHAPHLVHKEDYVFSGRKVDGRRQIKAKRDLKTRIFGIDLSTKVGHLSDGASVPKFADDKFGFDPLKDEYLWAAWWHDYIYSERRYSKWLADLIFFVLQWRTARHLKHNFFRTLYYSTVTYFAVVIGGPKYKVSER